MATMAARFAIPDYAQEGFRRLGRLDEAQFKDLLAALSSVPFSSRSTGLPDAAAAAVASVDRSDVLDIVESVWPLAYMQISSGVADERFRKELEESIRGLGATGGEPGGNSLVDRVSQVVSSFGVWTSAKARVVLEDGNSYCRSRILTDIRPVFGRDANEAPIGAVIVHHLTLSYHKDGLETEGVSVSLSEKDIEQFIETLRRAQQKQSQLQPFVEGFRRAPTS